MVTKKDGPRKKQANAPVAPAVAKTQSINTPGFPIVGIGASAGCLEAREHFFRKAPPDGGMAFVLVPHFDPRHASILTEIL